MPVSGRANVVLFITHDSGRFVSPYGVPTVNTPHCQRLADEGVRFSNAFCTSPLCSPSRASITTGLYPHQNGVMGLTSEHFGGFDLKPDVKHASTLFAQAGYETVLCGFQHETGDCRNLGFHRFISGPGKGTNGPQDSREHPRAIDSWLAERDQQKPFYLQIGCHETHLPWDARETPPDSSKGVFVPPYLNDTPEIRSQLAQFQGAVARMDEVLGQILSVLDRRGLTDDTLFVFTTDHGIDVPMAKGTFYDDGLGVFLFMRYPRAGWKRGAVVPGMVSQVDLLPTLLECCGLPTPSNLEGKSLLPLLKGEHAAARSAIFAEKTFHDDYEPVRAIRTERFKYIRYFEAHFHHDLRTATIPQRHWIKRADRLQRRWTEELFDLSSDPGEQQNLIADPNYQQIASDLRRQLRNWMRTTQDPLLNGPVESPRFKRLREQFLAE